MMKASVHEITLIVGIEKSIQLKIMFRKSKYSLSQTCKNMTSNPQRNQLKNHFGKISSTSVPGGNQVDGLPPASSIGYLPTETRIFRISLIIRFVLNYHGVHDDTLMYLGMCRLSSFEDYSKQKRWSVDVDFADTQLSPSMTPD